ncbi:methyltransferase [Streptomyces boncukensis]|uniref:Methyltransferase n=1 Tax=Streptomyces boncukensis TaxID=2711219 RepID=A0A6G4X9M3_9ACTN|nr:methyltransferase [Streptomyces boncukensis]NGO73361.1 methyltransferase [Streptomyces boncukensis]
MAPDERDGMADRRLLIELLFGQMATQIVGSTVRLGLMDRIGDRERTVEDLAAECGTLPGPTHRLLRALAGLGLVSEVRPGAFAATSAGALLAEEHPHSQYDLARSFTDPLMTRAWDRLDDSLRTGGPAFDTVFGTDFFGYLKGQPELSACFNRAMGQASRGVAESLPHGYDFGRFRTVVDVGGGNGSLLAAILRAHPGSSGVVYDTAEGLGQAEETLREAGLGDRASAVAGDFFASVPEGGDLYLLKSIIHDWNDEQCATILRNIRDVLPPDGRVLIVEPVLPELANPDGGATAYLSDLNMLVNLGGRERTREDFAALCAASGLTAPAFLDVLPVFSVIETTAT